jgi:hypothetical protein
VGHGGLDANRRPPCTGKQQARLSFIVSRRCENVQVS